MTGVVDPLAVAVRTSEIFDALGIRLAANAPTLAVEAILARALQEAG